MQGDILTDSGTSESAAGGDRQAQISEAQPLTGLDAARSIYDDVQRNLPPSGEHLDHDEAVALALTHRLLQAARLGHINPDTLMDIVDESNPLGIAPPIAARMIPKVYEAALELTAVDDRKADLILIEKMFAERWTLERFSEILDLYHGRVADVAKHNPSWAASVVSLWKNKKAEIERLDTLPLEERNGRLKELLSIVTLLDPDDLALISRIETNSPYVAIHESMFDVSIVLDGANQRYPRNSMSLQRQRQGSYLRQEIIAQIQFRDTDPKANPFNTVLALHPDFYARKSAPAVRRPSAV